MKKRIVALLLTSLGLLASCGENPVSGATSDTVDSGEKTSDESKASEDNSSAFEDTCSKKTSNYRLIFTDLRGIGIRNVDVTITSDDKSFVISDTTSKSGTVNFEGIPAHNYTVDFASEDYTFTDQELTLSDDKFVYTFEGTPVIPETELEDTTYKVGDVVHDFTFTDVNGTDYELKELLKTYKAVVLDFFYIDCYYCNVEFPYLNEAYTTVAGKDDYGDYYYSDEVAVLSVDVRAPGYMDEYGDYLYENREAIAKQNNLDASTLTKEKLLELFCDTESEIKAHQTSENTSIPMGIDPLVGTSSDSKWGLTLSSAFGVSGTPTTVIIDRYGYYAKQDVGAVHKNAKAFTDEFDTFIAEDYSPKDIK